MKYADFIKGNEGFQYSVNLQYDLYNNLKIKGYIPTKKSVELLSEYILNTKIKGSNKSTVLIGPYGKGKSHLLLVLLNILSDINNDEVYELIGKIEKIDLNCAELIREIYGKKKYMPIIINSNSIDLNQSFLIALKQSLDKIDECNILPNTYFDSAINVINGWESYKDTYNRFEKLVNEACGVSTEIFINQLSRFNKVAYDIFRDIFKNITSGVDFNPLVNTDIVKLYEEVNYILHDKYNYDGMIIVFDEFSKFIEASATDNTSRDLKILQDFAELANRAESPQMHLICVTHKTVNEYISQIPQDKVDAWRAIEGRFKEIYFNSSSQQNYELISNAIIKDEEKFEKFWMLHKEDYERYYDGSFSIYNNLYLNEDFNKHIIKGCFPLSPYATYALPKVSEKVAQNERTLFTFLSKLDKNSLLDIIKNNEGETNLITIDNIYEYFEPLFKKEVFNEKIHDLWLKTDTALRYTDGEKEAAVIKALAIIYIINDFKVLSATVDNIKKALGFTKDEINTVVGSLRNKNVLMLRKSTSTLDFMPISGIDIEGKIKSLVEAKVKNINISEVLNELIDLKYILPRRYNDEFKMVRYFKRLFMTARELVAYDNIQLLLDNKSGDGLFVNVVCEEDDDKNKLVKWIDKVNDDRVSIVMPVTILNIKEYLARYLVLNELLKDNELLLEDPVLETQLNVLIEDTMVYIKNKIEKIYNLENEKTVLLSRNIKLNKVNKIKLSELASEICYRHYSNAPIINNELINKKEISSPILKARNTIVKMILENEYTDFNSNGNSVECTLFRTTLKNKGFLNNTIADDMKPLLGEIKNFIIRAEVEEVSFKELYENIITNANAIAARDGIIPIYLAFIIKDYINEAVILIGDRNKKEVALTVDIINNINSKPAEYFLKIEKGTKEKENYVNELESIFEKFRSKKITEGRYFDLIKSMQTWSQSLSKYSKTSEIIIEKNISIDKSIIKLRKSLVKFDINSRQFIYKDLPKIFDAKNLTECIEKLKKAKECLESRDRQLVNVVTQITKNRFNKEYKGSLASSVQIWLYSIDEAKINHLYDSTINSVLQILRVKENNDEILINKLAYALTGLALEDWNDNSIIKYADELNRTIKRIEEFEVECDSDGHEGLIKLSFVSPTGESDDRTFDRVVISPMGEMLMNNLEEAFDEFGDSIDDNEKRNVIIKMLEKFI